MVLRRRRYTPLIPLLFLGISLIWLGSNGGENPPPQESLLASKIEEGQVKGPPGSAKRSVLHCRGQPFGGSPRQHGAKDQQWPSGQPSSGQGQRKRRPATATEPCASVVQAVQSISTRSAQDLWSPTPSVFGEYTAEQSFQRRSNATNRLAKRLAGNARAKDCCFGTSYTGTHVPGPCDPTATGRGHRDGSPRNESSPCGAAIGIHGHPGREIAGTIWTAPQEQEVLRLAWLCLGRQPPTLQPTLSAPTCA